VTGAVCGAIASGAVPATAAGVVTLSGTASHTESGVGTQEIRLRFNTDGTVDLYKTSTGYVQISASTDWIIPNGSADSSYEVRCASVSSGVWTTQPAAVGTWLALSSNREWLLTDTDASPFNFETISGAVFEIRKDGGAALDSGTYPISGALTANRTS